VSLEQPFWDELNRLARQDEISLSALINQIDKDRKTNLSSALRLYVLYILQSSMDT
jgi:predicted DNA-binding ribbon-helix-helix protein